MKKKVEPLEKDMQKQTKRRAQTIEETTGHSQFVRTADNTRTCSSECLTGDLEKAEEEQT